MPIIPNLFTAAKAIKKLKPGVYSSGVSAEQQAAIDKYSNTQYADLVRSNPYENYSRQNSIWDSIGDLIGFRTGADTYAEDMALASKQHLMQIDSLAREESYNSESAKAARMRAAGLNPDLVGLDGSSSASEYSEPEASPTATPGATPSEVFADTSSVASMVLDLGSTGIAIAQSLQGIRGAKISNAKSLLELVVGAYGSNPEVHPFVDNPVDTDDPNAVLIDGSEVSAKVASPGEQIASILFGSGKTNSLIRSEFSTAFDKYSKSVRGKIQGKTLENADKSLTRDINEVQSDPYYAFAERMLELNDVGVSLRLNEARVKSKYAEIRAKFLASNEELVQQGMTAELTAQTAENLYQAGVFDRADVELGADAFNEENKAKKLEALARQEAAELASSNYEIFKSYYKRLEAGKPGYVPGSSKNLRLSEAKADLRGGKSYYHSWENIFPDSLFNWN